jgi:hypothetical protein
MNGLHAVTLTDQEVLYLRSLTYFQDGMGRDLYVKFARLCVNPPKAQLPLTEARS